MEVLYPSTKKIYPDSICFCTSEFVSMIQYVSFIICIMHHTLCTWNTCHTTHDASCINICISYHISYTSCILFIKYPMHPASYAAWVIYFKHHTNHISLITSKHIFCNKTYASWPALHHIVLLTNLIKSIIHAMQHMYLALYYMHHPWYLIEGWIKIDC